MISTKLVAGTCDFFQQKKVRVSSQEARTSIKNITNFFELLDTWKRNKEESEIQDKGTCEVFDIKREN